MSFEIEHEDNSQRGMFYAKKGEVPAGLLSYIWADNKHIIVYFTEALNGYDNQGVGDCLIEAMGAFARDKDCKIIPLSSYAKKAFSHKGEFADLIESN